MQNGSNLEVAQQMAGHESARTTGLYDRCNDTVALRRGRAGGVLTIFYCSIEGTWGTSIF